MTTRGTPKRATRPDYTPGVRARAARQDGQRRLTPGYLEDLSDTKIQNFGLTGGSTARETLITPSKGRAIRIVRIKFIQEVADGLHSFELYFGTAATLSTSEAKAIDIVRVPDLSEGATRTWSRGTGPIGAKDEVVSVRARSATASGHFTIAEYTEER